MDEIGRDGGEKGMERGKERERDRESEREKETERQRLRFISGTTVPRGMKIDDLRYRRDKNEGLIDWAGWGKRERQRVAVNI